MIFGNHDANTLEQFESIRKRSVKASLMADGHYGYIMPVGGVAAYENEISINGVGYDIACGNCAIKSNITFKDLIGLTAKEAESNPHSIRSNPTLNRIADEITKNISFGLGRSNKAHDAPVDHPLFLDPAWYAIPNIGGYRDELKDKARRQLGTIGSGNHYVDLFVDRSDDHIWIGVHFGSRGLGHTIASNYLAIGQGGTWGDRAKEQETIISLNSTAGDEYWSLMTLAGLYAYVGREWVARTVLRILEGIELDLVHNHHNFAWKEQHIIDGILKEVVVVRKGATPSFPGQRGFVGGSMGDDAVILQGVNGDSETSIIQQESLFSTVHGSGRVMSRAEAIGKRDYKTGQLKKDKLTGAVIRPGKITYNMMQTWMNQKGVILRGGGLDESPQVYRRLPEVLVAQKNTVEILHTLRPIIVVMAGPAEVDPYKD